MAADLGNPADVAEISKSHAISNELAIEKDLGLEKEITADPGTQGTPPRGASVGDNDGASLTKSFPTQEEFQHLRRVPGSLNWPAYTVAFVELCERFSYYGTTIVCMCCPTPVYCRVIF